VTVLNRNSAYRHLAQRFCATRFAQGFFHEEFVGVGHEKGSH
jgi:hypothetical protein